MTAGDPSYPAFPIASALGAAMLSLVLLTSLVRQNWNLGVAFLCVWLCLENVGNVVNTTAWSDNVDVKLFIWCDIVTRLNIAVDVGMNMAPLLITRRLYQIASLRSLSLPDRKAKRMNRIIEWTLGFVWPLVAAGPLYYVLETTRFNIIQGYGCTNGVTESILTILLTQIYALLPPLISVLVYYPKVAYIFYRQNKDINEFLHSDDSVSRTGYLHVLAAGSMDILLTLPFALVFFAFLLRNSGDLRSLPFYPGWEAVHSDWTILTFTYSEAVSGGAYSVATYYIQLWTTPIESFVIFGLFGLTKEARTSYWHIGCTISGWFGREPADKRADPELCIVEFGGRLAEGTSLDSGISTASFVRISSACVEPGAERGTKDTSGVPTPKTDRDKFECPVSPSYGTGRLDSASVVEEKVEEDTGIAGSLDVGGVAAA
ncbi:unnamed protein product [Peniophora sp. CBMAI 1063]|nr:unnamed protein product [Peniophora sp. CBMAI 1063]